MKSARRAAVIALPIALAAVPAAAAPADAALDTVRQQCIAAVPAEQRDAAAVAEWRHRIALLAADAAGRRRDIDDSRPQQAHLLDVLAFLARHRGDPMVAAGETPLDRRRGELLIGAAAPALRAEARALITEIDGIGRLEREAAARQPDLAAAEAALAQDRSRLAQFVAQRLALTRRLLPDPAGDAALRRMADAATDLGALIRLADAAAERRDRALAARRLDDPTRPAAPRAFDPPQSALSLPVSGAIRQRFGEPDANGTPASGLGIAAALPAAAVVAPFDGEVIYAGAFGDLGPVLIIRHGALYHSVLAGLGRIGVIADEWVRTGEPVGTTPEASAPPAAPATEGAGSLLYFELRRDGRPVDPQPWLARRTAGRAAANGEQRVSR
jgi:septal ring factor EnvC (AmiA/AmiB activator)